MLCCIGYKLKKHAASQAGIITSDHIVYKILTGSILNKIVMIIVIIPKCTSHHADLMSPAPSKEVATAGG